MKEKLKVLGAKIGKIASDGLEILAMTTVYSAAVIGGLKLGAAIITAVFPTNEEPVNETQIEESNNVEPPAAA